jgi:prepilin-type N-terminal cleavage/methylation domain-containing protein
MFFKKKSNKYYVTHAGFSLVELLVSISIIVLVSGVVLARNNSFEGALLLRNQAFLVASTVREAQLLAVSGTGLTSQAQRYGVFVTTTTGQQNTITVFRDANNNRRFDSGEVVSVVRIDPRFRIDRIQSAAGTTYGNASVTFLRPNYDATFSGPSAVFTGPIHIHVRRVGKNGNDVGSVRRVTITSSGQVSVTAVP